MAKTTLPDDHLAITEEVSELPYYPAYVVNEPTPLTVINPDPQYDYGWFSTDPTHPQYWVRMQEYGWRRVDKVGGKETNPLKQQIYRDLVLMRRPKKLSEEINRRKRRAIEDRIYRSEKQMETLSERFEKINRDYGGDE